VIRGGPVRDAVRNIPGPPGPTGKPRQRVAGIKSSGRSVTIEINGLRRPEFARRTC
jgi:hypothetical protein